MSRARSSRPRRALADSIRALGSLAGEQVGALRRAAQALSGQGAHGAPIGAQPTVLLFFEDVERDRWVRGDRRVRRAARRIHHAVTAGQRVSGFEVAFRMLHLALTRAGCRVVVNNERLARRHPEHPVGICGYPHVLDRWRLPNPAVLGPGLFDHPGQAPRLMEDPRFRSYLVPSEWMRALFSATYGPACRIWFAGIDLEHWADTAHVAKDIDLLVYEKTLWRHEETQRTVIEPILHHVKARGLRAVVVRRGMYEPHEYRALLARSRAMLFLCEHETQGLAYQEALASNVPVLAWNRGVWLDPIRLRFGVGEVPASSVPHFSGSCGECFRDADDFPSALDRFMDRLPDYTPRGYVTEHLSIARSAEIYLDAYRAAAR